MPFVTRTLSIPTNGIRLHIEASGPENGPLVILLHGFPEYWGSFGGQIAPLARSGYHVIAPDQRGYNLSDKPAGIDSYRVEELARDVLGIINSFGREKAVIVGHDWGGVVAWHLAIHFPERVERLCILNAPHPAAMAYALTHPLAGQLLRSVYIYFFQIPWLPEALLRFGRFAALRRAISATARPGTISKHDLRRYQDAWSPPRALTSMLNWYRAAVQGVIRRGRDGYLADAAERVSVPTLILWGERDPALAPKLAQWSLDWCDQGELVRFPEATHWLQHDEAVRVAARLLDFIGDPQTSDL